jgi:hypothetical protein
LAAAWRAFAIFFHTPLRPCYGFWSTIARIYCYLLQRSLASLLLCSSSTPRRGEMEYRWTGVFTFFFLPFMINKPLISPQTWIRLFLVGSCSLITYIQLSLYLDIWDWQKKKMNTAKNEKLTKT